LNKKPQVLTAPKQKKNLSIMPKIALAMALNFKLNDFETKVF
jgi:hypothetical protein